MDVTIYQRGPTGRVNRLYLASVKAHCALPTPNFITETHSFGTQVNPDKDVIKVS